MSETPWIWSKSAAPCRVHVLYLLGKKCSPDSLPDSSSEHCFEREFCSTRASRSFLGALPLPTHKIREWGTTNAGRYFWVTCLCLLPSPQEAVEGRQAFIVWSLHPLLCFRPQCLLYSNGGSRKLWGTRMCLGLQALGLAMLGFLYAE